MTLPTREEIAEILDRVPRVCAGRHYGDGPFTHAGCLMIPDVVGQADALLAHLRPAWEELSQRAQDWGVMFDKSWEHAATLSVERDALRDDYVEACRTISKMHEAAIGEVAGPRRGVVEDVEDLRADLRASQKTSEQLLERLNLAEANVRACAEALTISPDDVGHIMHESWTKTKRAQGFHHPDEQGHGVTSHPCPRCHADLIPWERLSEPQKDINRHAFDDVLAEIRRRAALDRLGVREAVK